MIGTIHHAGLMKIIVFAMACALLALSGPSRPARAQGDYFGEDAPEDKITFRKYKERTCKQRWLIGALFGGAVVFGGIGVYFTLDSRTKADEVGVVGRHSGLIYTRDIDDTRKSALLSRNLAIANYSVGGLFLLGAVAALYLTDPGSEVVSVGDETPPKPAVPVSVAPVPGGAVIGGAWSF